MPYVESYLNTQRCIYRPDNLQAKSGALDFDESLTHKPNLTSFMGEDDAKRNPDHQLTT